MKGEAMSYKSVCQKLALGAIVLNVVLSALAQDPQSLKDYKLLATNRTSTMQKELNETAAGGYRFEKAMGGDTFGGSEVVAVMSKDKSNTQARFEYKLLATNKTSTMQKELQEAGDAGFEYRDQTVFKTAFGGEEVVVILEKDRNATVKRFEYQLLATNRTSTMQKELLEAAERGFQFVGMTVAKSAFGGNEVITILRREVR
jgi:hypothetical protein